MRTYAAQLTADELQAAREWCADCIWRDVDADYILEEAAAEAIARAIARHYDGGIAEFKRNHAPAAALATSQAAAASTLLPLDAK